MEDKYPCMHTECDKEAVFGVDMEGGETTLCEEHLWQILDNKNKYGYLGQYKLNKIEER
jgi:hypothetical protein